MQFQVPQFIRYEAKIVGPLTFKQFIFLGIAGAFLFVIYFLFPLRLFLIATIIIGGGSLVLVFFKINGLPLLTVLKNFFIFSSSNKLYLWKKKKSFVSLKPLKQKKPIIKQKKQISLKINEKSQLKKLMNKIEIGL